MAPGTGLTEQSDEESTAGSPANAPAAAVTSPAIPPAHEHARVVCVSLLIYIRTNTHAHTRTRGPAVGLEPRADNNDPAYPQTQIPSSGPHVRSWPPPPLSGGERERTHLYVPTAIRWGSMGRHALKWSNVCGRLTRMGATHAAAKSDRLIRTVLLSAKM